MLEGRRPEYRLVRNNWPQLEKGAVKLVWRLEEWGQELALRNLERRNLSPWGDGLRCDAYS